MTWIIVIGIILFILFKFFLDVKKDDTELSIGLDTKFKIIVEEINDAAYKGAGTVKYVDQREFSLYKQGSKQIIFFHYGTGILTITWRYKYFQKEIVHERSFNDVINLSVFEQQNIAISMIKEMVKVIENHQYSMK